MTRAEAVSIAREPAMHERPALVDALAVLVRVLDAQEALDLETQRQDGPRAYGDWGVATARHEHDAYRHQEQT